MDLVEMNRYNAESQPGCWVRFVGVFVVKHGQEYDVLTVHGFFEECDAAGLDGHVSWMCVAQGMPRPEPS